MSIYYFAYGSNLHPLRLKKRIPNARLISKAQLKGYRLRFNKKGQDGSSKCNIHYTGHKVDFVHGAVYGITESDLETLDKIEGLNCGYIHQYLALEINRNLLQTLTYIAMPEYLDEQNHPFTWYRDIVIEGMEFLGFNREYIQNIKEITGKEDDDKYRHELMYELLHEMKAITENTVKLNTFNEQINL